MFYAPVNHREYPGLELPAPQALDTKFRSANRGNPKTGRAVHQTKNLRLMTKLKSKVQSPKSKHRNTIQCQAPLHSVVHFNGTEAQPANQPDLPTAGRLLATLGVKKEFAICQ